MGDIKAKNKDVVVPGEVIAVGMDVLPGQGTYRRGEEILAQQLGLMNVDGRTVKLISLSGRYLPKAGDFIIGKIVDINFSGWRIDTHSAYSAMLSVKDATSDYIARGANLTQYIDFGELVFVKITNVTSQKLVDVTMRGPGLRKLEGGRLIEVSSNKIPRIIGKAGSMVSMIKGATGCKIVVGQNGLIWISGEPDKEAYAIATIRKIEKNSHTSGLTDIIKKELEERFGPIPEPEPEEHREQREYRGDQRDDRRSNDQRRGPRDRKFSRGPPRRRFRTPVE